MKDCIESEYIAGARKYISVIQEQQWVGYSIKLFFLSYLLLLMQPLQAQQTPYAVQANIIYRFTKYVNWPDEKKSGDFIIGIVGDTPLYDELKNFVANKTVGNQKIIVKRFPASGTAYNCHILFISEDETSVVKRIAAGTAGTFTLLVTESDHVLRSATCINFVIDDDHLKLEINKGNIEKRDLSIATELLSLGKIVK